MYQATAGCDMTPVLPGPLLRQYLYDQISPGKTVSIQTKHGLFKGRVVMLGPAGWVLDLGGQHGTPGIASAENVVAVSGVKPDSKAARDFIKKGTQ